MRDKEWPDILFDGDEMPKNIDIEFSDGLLPEDFQLAMGPVKVLKIWVDGELVWSKDDGN